MVRRMLEILSCFAADLVGDDVNVSRISEMLQHVQISGLLLVDSFALSLL